MDHNRKLERDVMKLLLQGEHLKLQILAQQFALATLENFELTGAGFFATYNVPPTAPRLDHGGHLHIGDVIAELEGLRHGAGFVLHVKNGTIDFLEGYSYEEPWPAEIKDFRLMYQTRDKKRDLSCLDD